MKLVISGVARAEIARITDYIATENPRAALRIAAQFRHRLDQIKQHPLANALLPGFEHLQVRRKVHGNYLILYRVTGVQIEIVHVLHGAMDYQRILGWDL